MAGGISQLGFRTDKAARAAPVRRARNLTDKPGNALYQDGGEEYTERDYNYMCGNVGFFWFFQKDLSKK